jgi:hypothetical protein
MLDRQTDIFKGGQPQKEIVALERVSQTQIGPFINR